MTELRENWLSHLIDFREQGMRISDINPVAALADIICEQLYGGEINLNDLDASLEQISHDLWTRQRQHLRLQTGIANTPTPLPDLSDHDITQPVYRAVFTAHPVFALRHDVSMALCSDAEASGTAAAVVVSDWGRRADVGVGYTPRAQQWWQSSRNWVKLPACIQCRE